MPRKRRAPTGRLSKADLIRVADGIVDPNPDQIGVFRGFYQAKFGVALEPEEVSARLRHLASLYALLRGHERDRSFRRDITKRESQKETIQQPLADL